MGRIALSPRRPRQAGPWIALLLVLAGCRGETLRGGIDTLDPADTIVAIGVVDLRPGDVDPAVLPALVSAAEDAVHWTDARASGTGTAGALAVLDGRPALDQVRTPRDPASAWEDAGRRFEVHGIAPTLRSEPEASRALGADVAVVGNDLASFDPPPDGGVHALLVDPFATGTPPGPPAPGASRVEGLRWIDTDLVDRIDALREREGVHVLLYGIVRSPGRTRAAPFGPGRSDDPVASLTVPVLWWEPRTDARGARLDTPITARDPVSTILGRERRSAGQRWAVWFNAGGGGVALEVGERVLVHRGQGPFELRAVADGSAEGPDLADDEPSTATALADRFAEILFGRRPRAWIALRGSEAVDFVDLTVLTSAAVEPWALEDIDTVRDDHPRILRCNLAAEPRADGVVVELGWPPVPVEARITGSLDQASWLGPLVHLGQEARIWGRSTLRLEPWSRAFWTASSGTWPEAADSWWRDAPVGLHAIVTGDRNAPAPATWAD
ncbi:MAG TPA: hypothetical protein VKA86_12690 [Candidatus Krumholzibacteria bacterium]|nr:hypothetical protein [Candidatus Krumholzibacteria bacterium]